MRSERGLTLLEIILVMGLSTMIYLATGELMVFLKKANERFEDNIQSAITEGEASYQLFTDLSNAGVSFNTLFVADQLNTGPNTAGEPYDFFEYLPDAPCIEGGARCQRRIAISPGVGEIMMLVEEAALGGAVPLNPNTFFTAARVSNPLNLTEEGVLTFRLDDLRTQIDNQNPELLTPNRLVQFYSPIPLRRATGPLDLNRAPRFNSFIGYFDVNGLFVGIPPSSGIARQAHAAVPSINFATVEQFFRRLPPTGGQAAFAIARRVKLVRYRMNLDDYQGYETGRLVRQEFLPETGAYGREISVAFPVCGVEFLRNSVNLAAARATVYADKNALNRVVASENQRASRSMCARDQQGNIVVPNSLQF